VMLVSPIARLLACLNEDTVATSYDDD